ncbi:MAG: sulfatase-like hydrolase/transferase [Thermoanaerobaculia bacterium]
MKRTLIALLALFACAKRELPEPPKPSILLVTLDTTRADAIGADTPSFNALAARARNFRYAYATAPQTLPSHSSMLTGLYPAGHGVHENARYLAAQHPLAAEKLAAAGYRTAAFVSAFPLARRFGLARGFETYDDETDAGRSERASRATTDRAIAWLAQSQGPVFLWVHYYDPHFPYTPSYREEVKTMDAQLGRLLQAYEQIAGEKAIIVVADHGEGLGEHGEAEHGNLLYQSVMHVPLLVAGPGVAPAVVNEPVSTRRVFHTILDFAGIGKDLTLREPSNEVVVGEAMGPFLQYGWQPQIMAVEGRRKAIHAGALEVYDVIADPAEAHDLGPAANLSRDVRKALLEYPVPSLEATIPPALDDEARKRLASLGYISAETKPVIRKDAPRPRDMTPLFATLDAASSAFVRADYASAIPLLEKVLAADPYNVTAALRIAAAHSALGHNEQALAAFHRAETIAPNSPDVRHYVALHYARIGDWEKATPMLERDVAEAPDRLPALEVLAEARERQRQIPQALQLWRRIHSMRAATPQELVHVGELAMAAGDTPLAIESFERARDAQGAAFRQDLELGALYLVTRRFAESRDALDRVPPSHPEYPLALFKRAQVSVLLNEPDQAARIAKAREHADETTRALIENEKLFGRSRP